jgi:hypothetical protein
MRLVIFMLVLTAGCLDSIVDNPCEDGYVMEQGECVLLVDHGMDDMNLPPNAEDPTEPVPPPKLPPDLTPVPPTTIDPTQSVPDPGSIDPCPTCH